MPDHVSVRVIADGAVLLNLESGQYHGLDTTGTAFWRALEANPSFGGAVDSLSGSFDIGAERIAADLEAFCHSLGRRGLIEIESVDD